jgi:hypothetical protein
MGPFVIFATPDFGAATYEYLFLFILLAIPWVCVTLLISWTGCLQNQCKTIWWILGLVVSLANACLVQAVLIAGYSSYPLGLLLGSGLLECVVVGTTIYWVLPTHKLASFIFTEPEWFIKHDKPITSFMPAEARRSTSFSPSASPDDVM